jgi:hypothetical protein
MSEAILSGGSRDGSTTEYADGLVMMNQMSFDDDNDVPTSIETYSDTGLKDSEGRHIFALTASYKDDDVSGIWELLSEEVRAEIIATVAEMEDEPEEEEVTEEEESTEEEPAATLETEDAKIDSEENLTASELSTEEGASDDSEHEENDGEPEAEGEPDTEEETETTESDSEESEEDVEEVKEEE